MKIKCVILRETEYEQLFWFLSKLTASRSKDTQQNAQRLLTMLADSSTTTEIRGTEGRD